MELKIGAHIAALRKKKDMTQEQLADALGVSPPAVSKWETDHSYPDITLLCPLARALNTDVDTLLKFEEELPNGRLVQSVNEIVETARKEGVQAAEEKLQSLLRRYPSSAALQYNATGVYAAFELLSPSCSEEEKGQWKRQRKKLLQEIYAGKSPDYWHVAVMDLAVMEIAEDHLDAAEKLLKELPEHNSDPTAIWARLYLKRNETDQALATTQKRLYELVGQVQRCLMCMLDQKMEPDPDRALAIANAYRQTEEIFGCGGGMSAGLFVELYLRAGQYQNALKEIIRYVDVLTGPAQMPKELLFSKGVNFPSGQSSSSIEMRQIILQAMLEDEELKKFHGEPEFQTALEKLKASLEQTAD